MTAWFDYSHAPSGEVRQLCVPSAKNPEALRELAARLGVPVEAARELRKAEPRGLDYVAGVGSLAQDVGAWFASSAQRPFLEQSRIADAVARARDHGARSLFVFVDAREWSKKSAQVLGRAAVEAGLDVGIWPVCAEPARAELDVLRLLLLDAKEQDYRFRLLGYSDFVELARRTCPSWCFGRSRVEDFLASVRAGSDALVLHTHSNGADMRLGAQILCVQADHLRPAPGTIGESFLPCHAGGPCLRDTRRTFIGAGALRCSVVIGVTCSMVSPSDALLGSRFTLASALLRGDHVRAVVAPCTVMHLHFRTLAMLHDHLANSTSAGTVARLLNADAGLPTYVCVGDPAAPVPARPAEASRCIDNASTTSARTSAAGLPGAPTRPESDSGRFHQRFLRRLIEAAEVPEVRERASKLCQRLSETATSSWGSDLDRQYYEVLAGFFSFGVYVHPFWASDFIGEDSVVTEERHACGHELLCHRHLSRHEAQASRVLWYCTRCAFAGEQPAGKLRMRASIQGDQAVVRFSDFPSEVTLTIGGSVEGVGSVTEVPLAPSRVRLLNGCGEVRLPVRPNAEFPGLRAFEVVAVWDGLHAVARVPLEGAPKAVSNRAAYRG